MKMIAMDVTMKHITDSYLLINKQTNRQMLCTKEFLPPFVVCEKS